MKGDVMTDGIYFCEEVEEEEVESFTLGKSAVGRSQSLKSLQIVKGI